MRIERIELHHVRLELVRPFETSVVRELERPLILVAVHGGGLVGWGECSAEAGPWHTSETIETAWHVLRAFLIPSVLGQEIGSPEDVVACFPAVRGHNLARAGLENAVWDLLAKARGVSLAQMIGGTRDRVPVGVSVGMEATLDLLLAKVTQYVADGYRRVKLKIKPGWDIDVVRAVRERWPELLLQVDANCAYTLADRALLRELDQFGLLLIEQPFHHDDILDHAKLQQELETPLCLDESIQSPLHARWALEIDACRIVNIKVGRVGGMSAARQIHDLCLANDVPVWSGGMLESNVGRAANVALASLPGFTVPNDISASARYYRQDIAEPNFVLNADSTLSVPAGPGLGVELSPSRLERVRVRYDCSD